MEAAERSELGDEKISGFRTPVWEREEKHEKGKECATGTDKGVQISEPQSIGARHKGLAQISGLDFTPHTPPKLITVQQSSISKAQPALTRSLSVFSRRRWRKKQPQLEGPQRIIEGTLDQLGTATHRGRIKEGHNQLIDHPQGCNNSPTAQPPKHSQMQDNNSINEAESLWQMIKELGVSSGNAQSNKLQQLIEMEERDTKEKERLGETRRC